MANPNESILPTASQNGADDWSKRFEEAEAERIRLQEELTRVKAERDVYLRSLYLLTRKKFSLSKEEALGYMGAGQPLHEAIEAIAKEEGVV